MIKEIQESHPNYQTLEIHFQDETRLGLIPETGRKITLKGVKPIGLRQYIRETFYIYGTISPSGRHFFRAKAKLNSQSFNAFLKDFGHTHRNGLHILVMDQARFHLAKYVKMPPNLIPIGLPPRCPELNPIERFWQDLKSQLKWRLFDNLETLEVNVLVMLRQWAKNSIRSIANFPYVRNAIDFAQL